MDVGYISMCGIAGFFGVGRFSDLVAMTTLMQHRGPDGEAFFVDSNQTMYLGHRRLAIRDLAGGSQPMVSDDRRYAVVYNGELYNDGAIRQELESMGHEFVTASDTEVLLRALIQWRLDCLEKLDGQFAFCFVDTHSREVLMARDRFGEKPLFWSQQPNGILFASESSALASHPWVTPKLDELACTRYLLMGYLPPPYSILSGVEQVRPGFAVHFRTSNLSDVGQTRFAQPWNGKLAMSARNQRRADLDMAHIRASVDSRRVSDVATGVLLSGGVDSTLVTLGVLGNAITPSTYTIGFESKTFDESSEVREFVAERQIKHHQKILGTLFDEDIQRIVSTLDEPIGDPSYVPTFEAFKLASADVKVLLTGDGGDELFFGYEPFRAYIFSRWVERYVPRRLALVVSNLLRRLPRSGSYMNLLDVVERFIDGLASSGRLRPLIWMSTLRTNDWKRFFTNNPTKEVVFQDFLECENEVNCESLRRLFLETYLPGSIFAKSDTAAMANSVESRAALMSPEIVDIAMNRLASDEISILRGKRSLRRLVIEQGESSVAKRRKHGFAFPISGFFQHSTIPAPLVHLATVDNEAIGKAWNDARAGKPRHVQFLWAVFALVNSRAYRVATSTKSDLH